MSLNKIELKSQIATALKQANKAGNEDAVAGQLADAIDGYVRTGTVMVGPGELNGTPVPPSGGPVVIPAATLTGKIT